MFLTCFFLSSCVAVKIKKPIKTKFRMPVFNWVALKPNQINGTVFNEIDDERILEVRQFFCDYFFLFELMTLQSLNDSVNTQKKITHTQKHKYSD